MVDIGKAVIARLTSHGHHFEILVDCDAAIAVKHGKNPDVHDVLAVIKIFNDAHKGFEPSPKIIEDVFKTTDVKEVAYTIIRKGELQLTQEYREKLREQKRRQIVDMIHVNGVDPQTHAPHPATRIEAAMKESHVHIDEFQSAESQLSEILKKLRVILPIKFEMKEMNVKISPQYTGKAYSVLRRFGPLLKEEWLNTGYLHAVVEIPGGLETDFYEQINSVCHGNVEVTILRTR
jgi:ribosome maturation protein SDO1